MNPKPSVHSIIIPHGKIAGYSGKCGIKKKCADCFRVLSDATRIRILKELQERKANVVSITSELGVTQPTVSYHLKLLDTLGFLRKERRGRETYYSFNKKFPCKGCGVFSSPIKL